MEASGQVVSCVLYEQNKYNMTMEEPKQKDTQEENKLCLKPRRKNFPSYGITKVSTDIFCIHTYV